MKLPLLDPARLRVKICGITNAADAAMAVAAGADALGFNLFPGSKRFVDPLDAAWIRNVPVLRVAVLVNPTIGDLSRVRGAKLFEAVQFHGDESPEFCASAGMDWIRAVRVAGPESLADALRYDTPGLLLDAHVDSAYGGTGRMVDPALAAEFVRAHPERRVVLAGGLRPDNVAAAVRAVRPVGVDVASGVERDDDPRRKDPEKVRAFIAAARGALAS